MKYSRSLQLFDKAVTDMSIGQEILGVCRIIFELFSQLMHKRAQILQFASILRAPHTVQQP